MGGDPIRRSGEIRVEQILGDLISQASERLEKQIGTLDMKFDAHAEKVNTRLAAGDTQMALMNQSIKSVQTEVTTMRGEIKEQSDKVRQFQPKADRTPQATPALEPKKPEPPWLTKTLRKGVETAVGACMSVILVGALIWVFKGHAAALISDPPAAIPATDHP